MRRAFTLVELLVTIVLVGLVLAGARAILEQMSDTAHRIAAGAESADRGGNADRVLRSLLGRLELGLEEGRRFAGNERTLRFSTWCDTPAGWQERCRVTIGIDTLGGAGVLAASLSTGELLVLRRGFRRGQLRYLSDPGSGGVWFRDWGTSVTAPVALGLVLDADTLIVRIGERG
jgi:prepilin-type N-terminal cleavage/methylation domain-containing protein